MKEKIELEGVICSSKKCKLGCRIGIANKCADKDCTGKLEEKGGKTICNRCGKTIKRAKYYFCYKCNKSYHKICSTRKFDGDVKEADAKAKDLRQADAKAKEEKRQETLKNEKAAASEPVD